MLNKEIQYLLIFNIALMFEDRPPFYPPINFNEINDFWSIYKRHFNEVDPVILCYFIDD